MRTTTYFFHGDIKTMFIYSSRAMGNINLGPVVQNLRKLLGNMTLKFLFFAEKLKFLFFLVYNDIEVSNFFAKNYQYI